MANRSEFLYYKSPNVMVLVPSSWQPDEATLGAMTQVSQLVLNKLHLNFGKARVTFIADAQFDTSYIGLRTHDRPLRHEADILLSPSLRRVVSGYATTDEVVCLVASAAAVTRYNALHPFSSERRQIAMQRLAQGVAKDVIESLRNK